MWGKLGLAAGGMAIGGALLGGQSGGSNKEDLNAAAVGTAMGGATGGAVGTGLGLGMLGGVGGYKLGSKIKLGGPLGAVGGALGGLALTGIGASAGLGAYTGAAYGDRSPGEGFLMGAGVGAAGLVGGVAAGAGIAGVGYAVAKNLDTIGAAGDAVVKGAGALGKQAVLGPSLLHNTANATAKLAEKMFKFTPTTEVFDAAKNQMVKKQMSFKPTKLGWGILGVGAAVGSIKGAYSEMSRRKMGQMDPYVARATPRVPSYANNAGASGDLVFALNANKRG